MRLSKLLVLLVGLVVVAAAVVAVVLLSGDDDQTTVEAKAADRLPDLEHSIVLTTTGQTSCVLT